MEIFALFVIVVCVGAIFKANRVLSESGLGDVEESTDWQWPSREWAHSETEER